MYKNVANQRVAIYAHDTAADAPKTGDAANITAYISLDGDTTPSACSDTNPTELDATNMPGVYVFEGLTAGETNGDLFVLSAKSSTADIQIDTVVIYTTPGTNAGVNSSVTQWNGINVATPTTAGVPTVALAADGMDEVIIEGTETFPESQRAVRSAVSCDTTNGGTKMRDAANTKNRLEWTLDGSGNRTLVTKDLT